jgi:hypothetical protein
MCSLNIFIIPSFLFSPIHSYTYLKYHHLFIRYAFDCLFMYICIPHLFCSLISTPAADGMFCTRFHCTPLSANAHDNDKGCTKTTATTTTTTTTPTIPTTILTNEKRLCAAVSPNMVFGAFADVRMAPKRTFVTFWGEGLCACCYHLIRLGCFLQPSILFWGSSHALAPPACTGLFSFKEIKYIEII